jgi:hypothetical protein
MRKIAQLKNKVGTTIRLMLCEDRYGFYLFGYDKSEDAACIWDEFYDNIDDLYERGKDKFDVKTADWIEIPKQLDKCQQDWIKPYPSVQ